MITAFVTLMLTVLFVWRIARVETAVRLLTQELRDFQERQEHPVQESDTENPKSGTMFG